MKQTIAIYTLTSELHDEKAVGAVTQAFLTSLGVEYELKGNDYGSHALNLIYVRTGANPGDGSPNHYINAIEVMNLPNSKKLYIASSCQMLNNVNSDGDKIGLVCKAMKKCLSLYCNSCFQHRDFCEKL